MALTHAQYLEKHHEAVTAVLPTIRLKLSQDAHDDAKAIFMNLDGYLSRIWTERQATAANEVNP